jgi:nicotinate-nucleotide pyrophosphorylase (carboxylating)
MKPGPADIRRLIDTALAEDCPETDITTEAVVPETARVRFRIVCRESAVACGAWIAAAFFRRLSGDVVCDAIIDDGTPMENGSVFLSGSGPARAVLTAERPALNLCQRLCGIATLTRLYVSRLEGTETVLLDTRKTTPGLRVFEKYAVRTGGGRNHRMHLSDRFLIKENHLAVSAESGSRSIPRAVSACRRARPGQTVEIEVRTPAEAAEAAEAGADIILLDNMTGEQIHEAVAAAAGRSRIEVSGGIRLDTLRERALPGIDFISTGAVIHSARSVDLSLLVEYDPS